MVLDAGARGLAQIDADVDAVRPVRLGSAPSRTNRASVISSACSSGCQRVERAEVTVRHHHQVAVVVGIEVEDDVGSAGRAAATQVDVAARGRRHRKCIRSRERERAVT